MAKKKANKVNTTQLQLLAKKVILAFVDGITTEPTDPFSLLGGYGGSSFGKYVVRHSKEYLLAADEFTRNATSTLKAKYAHEPSIRSIVAEACRMYVQKTEDKRRDDPKLIADAATKLVEDVLAEAGHEYVRYMPNRLIVFSTPQRLRLGRVEAIDTQIVDADQELKKKFGISFEVSADPSSNPPASSKIISMPKAVWRVETPATLENVPEEARWLIDVAVSFMRLRATPHWSSPAFRLGQTEADPIEGQNRSFEHFTYEEDQPYGVSWSLSGFYEINDDVLEALNAPKAQEQAATLFDPPKESLAVRLANGLGWLSRARQSSDRTERFVAFFTALEALLSAKSPGAPVAETIARSVSVIIAKDITQREAVFSVVKDLYKTRSNVIHRGERFVTWGEVSELQQYTEAVFHRVLFECELTMPADDFLASLARATHGTEWNPPVATAAPADQPVSLHPHQCR